MLPSWTELREVPARLNHRVRRARQDSRERLWTFRAAALARAHVLFDRADEWPAVGRLASAAGRVVDRELERLHTVPVEGWDELNARKAVEAVGGLDRIGLTAARRRELATKNRKTVLRAIDARLGPEAVAPSAPDGDPVEAAAT